MIKTAHILKYRNAEHIQFNKDLAALCVAANPDVLGFLAKFTPFEQHIIQLERVFKQIEASMLTKEIVGLDESRDRTVTGILGIAQYYLYHFNPEYVNAADLIVHHMKKYGGRIAKLSYQAETSAINDLVDLFKNDTTFKAAVNLLNLGDWFTELEVQNNAFNEKYIARVDEEGDKPQLNLRELRAESKTLYDAMIKRFLAHEELYPSDAHTALIVKINALIDKYNNIKRKHKDSEADISE